MIQLRGFTTGTWAATAQRAMTLDACEQCNGSFGTPKRRNIRQVGDVLKVLCCECAAQLRAEKDRNL